SLVKGHPDRTCGQPCPAGESAADGGRCVPTAVVSSQKKTPPAAPAHRDAASPPLSRWAPPSRPGAAPAPPARAPVRPAGADGDDEQPASGGLQTPPSGLTHQPTVGSAGYASREGRSTTPIDRGPSRRFDAQSFFKRLDRQSAN